MRPCVSVIMPTRDRRAILAGVLHEYLSQARDVGAEVIVVDDGSSDGTCALLTSVTGPRVPLRWISGPPAGPAAARNRGIEMARAPLLFFTGDDMFPQPNLLAGHMGAHATLRDAAVVGHVQWDPAMHPSPLMRCMAPSGPLFNFRKLATTHKGLYRFFYTANLSLAVETLHGERFHEGFTTAAFEDTELGFRLERFGVRLLYRPDLVVSHRHPMSAGDLARRLRTMREGRSRLGTLHPVLEPGAAGRAAAALLLAAVRAWGPLEGLLSMKPRAPKEWTESET